LIENQVVSVRWRRLAVILTMASTVSAAVIAGLQADANIRSETANRESQYFAILASGELYRQGLATDYEFRTLTLAVKDAQEATLLQLTALEQENRSEEDAAALSRLRATLAEARAERVGQLSVLLTDPAYMPAEEGGTPNMQAYLDSTFQEANRLVSLQNDAADAYRQWNQKSDAYVAVLAMIAMVLTLYGLAQASSERMQLPFLTLGSFILGLALFWTASLLFG
jgi:hypothetical protein